MNYQRISRKGLKLPKIINNVEQVETEKSLYKLAKTVKLARKARAIQTVKFKPNKGATVVNREAHELLVITKAKHLCAYVTTITEKSPKKFRFTFVNRLQNYCLDILENLYCANSLRTSIARNKILRNELQREAYVKLKLLSYIAFISYENECILKKQYEQISLQVVDCINLLVAWTKSDLLK